LGGPPPDDVDLFLADLDDEARYVKGATEVSEEALESSTSSEKSPSKEGFVRLADFLKRKLVKVALKNYPRSVRARAIMSYRHQKELFAGDPETDLTATSQFDKHI